MQLGHIALFQAVLQTGSLTAAADLLHISQPAASKRLQQAERALGFALFHRERGRLVPTRQGLILQGPTERLAADLQRLTQLAYSLRPQQQTGVRVICTPTLAHSVLPLSLVAWRALYPDVDCSLATEHTHALLAALVAGQADLGLTLQRIAHPGLQCEVLAQGQMQAIAPAGFWSVSEAGLPLQLASLGGLNMIGLDDKDGLGALLESHLRTLDQPVKISTRVQTYQLARHMVAAGQGVAIVDPFTGLAGSSEIMKTSEAIQTRPLSPPLLVTLYSVTRTDQTLTEAQQALLSELQRTAQTLLTENLLV
ncbi:LysR family transcriptional regulator [Oceanisphaera profunda]|uniref:LysR family transcriptional regulator n=1 Tax=Oceanisphaera profunda TaxID=1416627 RepID=A0A1Y0D1W4_9GAMM|nr:LysR substrate-binding domain-containing protein [Oceanisphaera profunda]ART81498.1 LysR family transcriptional regulator [Oceanisphaera profunda]